MSVKGIFKILIGTIVVMVVMSLVIEMLNITTVSLQLSQMAKLSCRQSAVLFSQETYKKRDSDAIAGGSVNMDTVRAADGATYVEGNFYGEGLNAEQIYKNVYTSPDFKTWLTGSAATKGHWKSIDLIDRALNRPGSLNVTLPSNASSPGYEAAAKEYTDAMTAKSYRDVLMTPLNMGVPYMDKGVLEKIFRWNLTQIASDCNSDAIRQDANGNYCVFYKGFRVYANQAKIKSIEYRVYDLDNSKDLQDFKELTHIDPSKLGYDDSLIDYMGGYENDDERKRICVAGLEFSVPIAYEGVTPIKSIFNFVWNTEVEGLDGTGGRDTYQQWNDATADLNSGGFGEVKYPSGVLPVPGKLIYYVVR